MNYLNYLNAGDFQGWKRFYNSIPRQIRTSQDYTSLQEYYRQIRYERIIANRNHNIVRTVSDSGPGTRAMIIGKGHVDKYFAKEASLVTLFEGAKIPVIVVGNKIETKIEF